MIPLSPLSVCALFPGGSFPGRMHLFPSVRLSIPNEETGRTELARGRGGVARGWLGGWSRPIHPRGNFCKRGLRRPARRASLLL